MLHISPYSGSSIIVAFMCYFLPRNCGNVFCAGCCHLKLPIPDQQLYDPVLVCNSCYDHIQVSRARELMSQHLKKPIATASSWIPAEEICGSLAFSLADWKEKAASAAAEELGSAALDHQALYALLAIFPTWCPMYWRWGIWIKECDMAYIMVLFVVSRHKAKLETTVSFFRGMANDIVQIIAFQKQ